MHRPAAASATPPGILRTRLPCAGTNRIRFEGLRLSALSAPTDGPWIPPDADGGAPLSYEKSPLWALPVYTRPAGLPPGGRHIAAGHQAPFAPAGLSARPAWPGPSAEAGTLG
jgi:hypothetical protein